MAGVLERRNVSSSVRVVCADASLRCGQVFASVVGRLHFYGDRCRRLYICCLVRLLVLARQLSDRGPQGDGLLAVRRVRQTIRCFSRGCGSPVDVSRCTRSRGFDVD